MHLDFDRLTGLLPFPPRILVDADQFLLLGIDRDNRLARFERSPNTGIDLDKLRIMRRPRFFCTRIWGKTVSRERGLKC